MTMLKPYEVVENLEKTLDLRVLDKGYCEEPFGISLSALTNHGLPLLSHVSEKTRGSIQFSNHWIQVTKNEKYRDLSRCEFGYIHKQKGFSIVRSPEVEENQAKLILNLTPSEFLNPEILRDPFVKSIDKNKDQILIEKRDEAGDAYYYIILEKVVSCDGKDLSYLHMKIRGDCEMEQEELQNLVNVIMS